MTLGTKKIKLIIFSFVIILSINSIAVPVPLVPGFTYPVSESEELFISAFSVNLSTTGYLDTRQIRNGGELIFGIMFNKPSECGEIEIDPRQSPQTIAFNNAILNYNFVGMHTLDPDDYAEVRTWEKVIVNIPDGGDILEIVVGEIMTDIKFYPATKVWVLTVEEIVNLGIEAKRMEKVVNIKNFFDFSPRNICNVSIIFNGIRIA